MTEALSDKQLRQRLGWARDRLENQVEESRATLDHLALIERELSRRIDGGAAEDVAAPDDGSPATPRGMVYERDPGGFVPYAELPVADSLDQKPTPRGIIYRLAPGEHPGWGTWSSSFEPGARVIFEAADPADPPMLSGGISFQPRGAIKDPRADGTWPELGLEIHGVRVGCAPGQNAVHVVRSTRMVVRGAEITCQHEVDWSDELKGRNGIFLSRQPTDLLVENCLIHNVGGQGLYHGVYTNWCRSVTVRNTIVRDVMPQGHALKLYAAEVLIEGNDIRHGPDYHGVLQLLDISAFAVVTIRGNTLVSNTDRSGPIQFRNRLFPPNSFTAWGQSWPDYAAAEFPKVIEGNTIELLGTEREIYRDFGTHPDATKVSGDLPYEGPAVTREPSVVIERDNVVS